MLKKRESVSDEIFSLVHGYYDNEITENVIQDRI